MIIRVPASTANIGPGFDCLGLAVALYQEIDIRRADTGCQSVHWEHMPSGFSAEDQQKNYTLCALRHALARAEARGISEASNTGFILTMLNSEIPPSRGLGSSAAAIVAGLYAANFLLDDFFSQAALIELGTEIEGHPDNIVPAIVGGLCISTVSESGVRYSKLPLSKKYRFMAAIPDFELSTEAAREALPAACDADLCIQSIAHTALLVHALSSGEDAHLSVALKDDFHTPHRLALIPDGHAIYNMLADHADYGAFISGAGPTLMALSHSDAAIAHIEKTLSAYQPALQVKWELKELVLDSRGALYAKKRRPLRGRH